MLTQSLEERYHDTDFWTGKLQLELFRLIKQHLEENKLSQNAFANQLGVSKGYMSQVLNGDFDHRLSKLVSLAMAVGKVPVIQYENVSDVISRAKGQYVPLVPAYTSAPQEVKLNNWSMGQEAVNAESNATELIFKDVA